MSDYFVQREEFEGWSDLPKGKAQSEAEAIEKAKKIISKKQRTNFPENAKDYRIAVKDDAGLITRVIWPAF